MKTAEEILRKWYNPLNRVSLLAELQIVGAMKEYAKEVAKEALKNASERDGVELTLKYVLKESILDESNIPEL